jgi:hypothetical protein
MEKSTIQEWDRRACTAIAFYSLIDPEDWVMAFGEMIPGLEPTYGLKISSLEKRITYWNYNKKDKLSSVSRLLEQVDKVEATPPMDDYTLDRLQDYFWREAVEKLKLISESPEVTKDQLITASVQAIAEVTCGQDGWMDKTEGAGRFCRSVLIKLLKGDSQVIEFFDSLSWLSRSVLYETKDREHLDSLGYEGVIQGIFEATHSMCSAYGGYDFSLNYLLRDVDKVIYFSKLASDRLETLDGIRALYRSNWKVIRDRIKEEMDSGDYLKLQAWIGDCRQQIEQAIKHNEKSCLRDICGQQQFIFGKTQGHSRQHASIALFIDILNDDLKGLGNKYIAETETAIKPDEQRSIVVERQQEEEQKKRTIKQIAQKEQEADEAYEAAIAINALPICNLKTQNDWRFEAWRLFVVCFFWQEEGFEGLGIPVFYLRNADEIIKQELEAFCTGSHSKSPTLWMWQYHSAIETLTLNQWVDDVLTRLQRARSIDSDLLFSEVARPTLGNRQLPIYGSPPRYCLYAALFEKLLLDPPDWIRSLPEQSGQILDRKAKGNENANLEDATGQAAQIQQHLKTTEQPKRDNQELNCPYDLSVFTTIKQKERFLFVWEEKPTLNEIQGKFKNLKRDAWNKSKDTLNQKLRDCEICFKNNRYEVIPLNVE